MPSMDVGRMEKHKIKSVKPQWTARAIFHEKLVIINSQLKITDNVLNSL